MIEARDIGEIARNIGNAVRSPLDGADLRFLRAELASARHLLLVADNVGELTADLLLLETIERLFPNVAPTLMVRGGPVLNDATREDLERSGFHSKWPVIDSGQRIPGLPLHRCTNALVEAFNAFDLVIAKGQGNWETLDEARHPGLFFLLTCKCPSVARSLNARLGTPVLRAGPAVRMSGRSTPPDLSERKFSG